MKIRILLAALAISLCAPTVAFARDVYVNGYYRSDGTYVRPHVRSSPDSSRANNYGPSRSSPQYSPYSPSLSNVSPYTRDHNRNGVANLYDSDDDSDGIHDNNDLSQYGRSRSGNTWFWP